MPKKFIKEVGEGTSQSYPTKRDTSDTFFRMAIKDEYDYNFTTDEGYTYSVILDRVIGWGATHDWEFEEDIEHFKKMGGQAFNKLEGLGITTSEMADMWNLNFNIKEHKNPNTGRHDDNPLIKKFHYTPSKGEFYKVMATLSKIVKDHMKLVDGKILMFIPQDPRRGKIFSHFILKQVPNIKYFEEGKTFYFIF